MAVPDCKDDILYLSHPYSNDRDGNFEKVTKIYARLLEQGYNVISPVNMTHHVSKIANISYDNYIDLDLKILSVCDGIILCDGYKESKGCMIEYAFATKNGKNVYFIEEFNIKES